MHCSKKTGNVLVLAEHREGEIDSVTFQLADRGRLLADRLNCGVEAILLGQGLYGLAKQLLAEGYDRVLLADHPLLEYYNPEIYSKVISDFFKRGMPRLFLLGYTYLGMELGPAIATRLSIPLASNCVDVEVSDDRVIVTRPILGGAVHQKLESKELPMMISLQKEIPSTKRSGSRNGTMETIELRIDPAVIKTRVETLLQEPVSGIDITKADVLVAVGQGVGKKANLEIFRELADALNGTLACTRPLAQWGWLSPDSYVGLSGKAVHPKLYIACGISGAPQHVSGMKDSNMIVAINSDPKAPIFQIAHYGIVGDMYEVVPALLKVIKENPSSTP
jgi:electron transfer flavoprotein alpha subunit